ncbi:hypothetical protein WR25_09849 isoform B [Diploscapter pachys]|uniref:Uncharacterized protein n=1 Tax=Diploscapter pachys TaxID=2018661 RepID=A0A2A2JID2_9BILA|nr:hypothetical protein WR25_09849 isoform B [Diploscapter pachys]
MEEEVIGIDLGTTYSCAAYVDEHGAPKIIVNSFGTCTTPSVVAYDNEGKVLVGEAALQSAVDPKNIVYDSKRMIGRQFIDKPIQDDMKLWPFKVVDQVGKPHVELNINGQEKLVAPEEVSAEILKEIRGNVEHSLGKKISRAVITVPAYFDNKQRQETMNAAEKAGLTVLRLVSEPTAAAIAYNLSNQIDDNILIYDLGGGTFDVSIVKSHSGKKLLVLAIQGHTHLGGQDFDQGIMEYALEEFKSEGKSFPEDRPKAMKRLRTACMEAKHKLTFQDKPYEIQIECEGAVYTCMLTKEKLEEICGPKIRGTLDVVDQALKMAELKEDQIKYVLLVGGSTRIPLVQNLLKEKFGGEHKMLHGINPDHAVAHGAAIYAHMLKKVTPEPKPRIKDPETKPATTISAPVPPPHPSSALQLEVQDIIPLSIGFECRGGLFQPVIEKGTKFPYKKETTSCTAYDNQGSVFSGIYEGERANVKNNFKLGEVGLRLLNKKEKQGYKLKETFEIDINGILHVTTTEIATGNKAEIEISYNGCAHKEV